MDPIVLLLVMFAVMIIPMFLMSNRQRKMMRQQQEMLNALEIGDEVRTHSGFYGLLVDQYDDVVVLETESGAQVKWARGALAAKVDPTEGAGGAFGDDTASDVDDSALDPASEEAHDRDRRDEIPGVTADEDHRTGR